MISRSGVVSLAAIDRLSTRRGVRRRSDADDRHRTARSDRAGPDDRALHSWLRHRQHRGDRGPAEQQGPRFSARSPLRFVNGRLPEAGARQRRATAPGNHRNLLRGGFPRVVSRRWDVRRKAPARSALRAQGSPSPRSLVPQKHIGGAGGRTARGAEGSADDRAHRTGTSRPLRASALHPRDRAGYRVSIAW